MRLGPARRLSLNVRTIASTSTEATLQKIIPVEDQRSLQAFSSLWLCTTDTTSHQAPTPARKNDIDTNIKNNATLKTAETDSRSARYLASGVLQTPRDISRIGHDRLGSNVSARRLVLSEEDQLCTTISKDHFNYSLWHEEYRNFWTQSTYSHLRVHRPHSAGEGSRHSAGLPVDEAEAKSINYEARLD